jgi:hypothetical protein
MLESWEQNCSNEKKRKLRNTDNEVVNLITLQIFSEMLHKGRPYYWDNAPNQSQGNCTQTSS